MQIDGIHLGEDLLLLAAVGIDGEGGEASARRGRRGHRECRGGAGAPRQPDCSVGSTRAVCRLFIIDGAEGTVEGDPQDLRPPHADPALPGSQGPQHHRAPAKPLHARVRKALRQAWELDDAEKAEKLIRNLARAPGTRGARRLCQHPRRHRRDPHRYPPRPAGRTPPLARLHQHHREHEWHGPARLPQR